MQDLTSRPGESMNHFRGQLRPLLLTLAGSMIGSVLLTGAATAIGIAALGAASWWRGWWAAFAVGLIASVISTIRVALSLCGGIGTTIAGFFAGMVLRMLLMLGGCAAAVMLWRAPAGATMLLASTFYLARLLAECVTLTRAFWPAPKSPAASHATCTTTAAAAAC